MLDGHFWRQVVRINIGFVIITLFAIGIHIVDWLFSQSNLSFPHIPFQGNFPLTLYLLGVLCLAFNGFIVIYYYD
jgi:uncharacterized BrkB/YihY/UPF0761 family membrane protein